MAHGVGLLLLALAGVAMARQGAPQSGGISAADQTSASPPAPAPASSRPPEVIGYAAVLVAALGFGSNFVPVKRYETGDGMFFQWLMCAAVWLWGFGLQLVLFAAPTASDHVPSADTSVEENATNSYADGHAIKFFPLATLGGALWATGNILAVPTIQALPSASRLVIGVGSFSNESLMKSLMKS